MEGNLVVKNRWIYAKDEMKLSFTEFFRRSFIQIGMIFSIF